MIRSFRSKKTERLFAGEFVREFHAFQEQAERKLIMLDTAKRLHDLGFLPGNRLEALKGDRAGQYSIRVNSQWRVCFRWTDEGPEDVDIVDYH